ncbi:glycoside hydrolase family 99-like domain-containing protein [Roseovarius salis]|uniref:glycoside hydrolase family 99-like domain-containing protein n=1 Tax=Roseovarius salis TaxID=3376063 RepID=UPI0037C604DF
MAQDYLNSGLVLPEMFRKVVGAEIRYGEEFLDLYSLLPLHDKVALFPIFDEPFYRSQRGDLPDQESALLDFLLNGLSAGVCPHPLVDLEYMSFIRPDFEMVDASNFSEFLERFKRNIVDPSPFFDIKYYRKNAKGALASPSALFDFLLRGDEAGCGAHPMVDVDHYRASFSDVPAGPAAAFLHFVTVGDAERRDPGSRFDPDWYSEYYAEDGRPLERPLAHYLRYGRFVSRAPCADEARTSPSGSAALPISQAFRPDRSSTAVLRNYADLANSIRGRAQSRAERFVERDIRPVAIEDPEAALSELSFAIHAEPQIDILIPCYQEFDKTVECLASIQKASPKVAVRVTLVDDCSPDPRYAQMANVPGLTYIRNEQNMHFLRSCNAAYARSKAPFVLLLNNDAQLDPDTLDRLWAAIDSDPDVAAAAPKILYPNGRLQEAGCTIEADGDTGMVGVGDDPDRPVYTHDRDIPYGSGACLLVRRDRVGEILFDERFAPAYCEDVDLCIRLRQAGGRIRYVGEARCIHHLSASTSAMSQLRRVQLVRRNQQKLLEKWGARLKDGMAVRVLAFYLPQFHPVPENDLWWGKGFTEWTNVTRAQPSYNGHYQPHLPSDLGFYDLRLVETMEEQMRMARRYGVHGFVMYYYNFQGERVLDRPLRNLLAHNDADFRFCLCWANENWTKHWDGGSQKHALMTQDYEQRTYDSFADDAIAAAHLPGAIKVNGLPLLLIYRPMLIPDVAGVCAYLRRRFHEAGLGGVYLAYVESMETTNKGIDPADLGFDASVEFPPQGIADPYKNPPKPVKPGFLGKIYDYAGTVVNACDAERPGRVRFPGVFPSWDNTPRQPQAHTTLEGALPERFQAYVEAKLSEANQFLSGDERLLFVNAWNEWAEGAHLEPDQMFEHDWLRAIGDVLGARQYKSFD